MAERRIPQDHVEILKKSGILNRDVTLDQIMEAATELDKAFPGQRNRCPP